MNVETSAGWGIIARSPHGRIDIMFGPVITTEAHPAFSGARTHSNNTDVARLPVMRIRVLTMTLIMLLVFAWARFRPVHMFNWHLHVSGRRYAPNTGYGLPCNTCTDTLGIWAMNVPIMPLHLFHLAFSPVTTLPLAGFVRTLTHLLVVMVVTASARFWKDCSTLEMMHRRYLKM